MTGESADAVIASRAKPSLRGRSIFSKQRVQQDAKHRALEQSYADYMAMLERQCWECERPGKLVRGKRYCADHFPKTVG